MIKKTDWNIKVDDNSISFEDRLFACRELTKSDLNLSINDVHDYININDIDIAVYEISMAVKKKKRILIMGDYDVDGTMSTIEFVKFFNSIGYHVDYYIPNRLTEGYGISHSIADRIVSEKKYDLIITVDNGIAAIEQIKKIVEAGITVIVTDHHKCKETLPPASAIIDCHRPDNTYPFTDLCGAGVVLKIIHALSDEFNLPEDNWLNYIEYAAIATISDVMPLVDENRIIVQEGLERIRNTKNSAILNLLRVADKLENRHMLQASDIGFYVGPLINASSRIGDVNIVMKLFLTDDEEEIIKYADELKVFNEQRKKIETQIFQEANLFLIQNYNFTSFNPIVVYGDNWHKGVIGIVASRLVETYSKPVIILSKTEDGLYHGSCRTYGTIDMLKILDSATSCIKEYGGHEGAAGLTVEPDKLEGFINAVNNYGKRMFNEDLFVPVLNADMSVRPEEINLKNYFYTETFAPFGQGNHDPVFVVKNVVICSIRKIGQKEGFENAHLKLTVRPNTHGLSNICIDGVGFFNSNFADIINVGDIVDIMFKPSINEWQGEQTAQMQILDIHCDVYQKEGVSVEEDAMYREDGISIVELAEEYMLSADDYIPSKDECYYGYKVLCSLIARQTNRVLITDLDILSLIVSATLKNTYISPFKLMRIIEINTEAGYFYFKPMLFGKIILALKDGQNIKKVSDTDAYKILEEEKSYFEA